MFRPWHIYLPIYIQLTCGHSEGLEDEFCSHKKGVHKHLTMLSEPDMGYILLLLNIQYRGIKSNHPDIKPVEQGRLWWKISREEISDQGVAAYPSTSWDEKPHGNGVLNSPVTVVVSKQLKRLMFIKLSIFPKLNRTCLDIKSNQMIVWNHHLL